MLGSNLISTERTKQANVFKKIKDKIGHCFSLRRKKDNQYIFMLSKRIAEEKKIPQRIEGSLGKIYSEVISLN